MSGIRGWTRRHFIGLTGVATGASLHPLASADRAFAAAMRAIEPRSMAQRSPGDDRDWSDVLGAFDLGGRITMNSAHLASADSWISTFVMGGVVSSLEQEKTDKTKAVAKGRAPIPEMRRTASRSAHRRVIFILFLLHTHLN